MADTKISALAAASAAADANELAINEAGTSKKLTALQLKTYITTAVSQRGARVYNSGAFSVPASAETAITFDSERSDTDTYHSTSSNTSRVTIPTGGAGRYVIVGAVEWAASALGTLRRLSIRLNGTTYIAKTEITSILNAALPQDVATVYDLADGDYLELVAFQDTVGAVNISAAGNYSPEFAISMAKGATGATGATGPAVSLGTTPSTQAFGDAAAGGSATDAAKTDHKHGMMALPAIDATGAATDITTRDASTSAHGLLPKLPNDATKLLNGLGAWTQTGWTVVTKASDESVSSSTTLQNDDELFFTASAGGKYEVEIVVLCTNAAGFTEDIKFAFGEDGTTRGHFMGVVPNAGDTTGVAAVGANQTGAIPCGLGTDIKIFKFSGTFYGNGGTFRVLWAQNTSGSNASTVKAGSLLRYRRVL